MRLPDWLINSSSKVSEKFVIDIEIKNTFLSSEDYLEQQLCTKNGFIGKGETKLLSLTRSYLDLTLNGMENG